MKFIINNKGGSMTVNTTESMESLKGKRQPCEVYSRIVGYLRPVQNWNDGKKAEYSDRTEFNIE
jgi:anaerobic ribonucleoside-triphosphate reductase